MISLRWKGVINGAPLVRSRILTRMNYALVVVATLVGVMSSSGRVRAQAQCDHFWQAAREARAEGNLVDARRFLEEMMACRPSVSAAFNLAAVLRDMGRYSSARGYLMGLLGGQFGPLPEERRRIVEGELGRIESALAVLEVSVEPAAELRLNGGEYGRFHGSRILMLDPGEWSLELRAEGYESRTEQFRLVSGQRLSLRYRLLPQRLASGARPFVERDGQEGADVLGDPDEGPRPLWPRRLGIALGVVGVVAAALVVGFVVRHNNQSVADPFFGNPST